jgi:hypothetical protein
MAGELFTVPSTLATFYEIIIFMLRLPITAAMDRLGSWSQPVRRSESWIVSPRMARDSMNNGSGRLLHPSGELPGKPEVRIEFALEM